MLLSGNLVAASSPWYSSGTFWAAAGIAVAIVAVIMTIILWRVGSPRRRMELKILTITPLLSRHWRGPELVVRAERSMVSDPYVVTVRLRNMSRRDIRSSDFDQAKPLVLYFKAPVAALEVNGSASLALDSVTRQSDALKVGPALIGGHQDIRLTVITDGEPAFGWESPLVGVNIEHTQREVFSQLLTALCLAGGGGLVLGITIAPYPQGYLPFPSYLRPPFIALIVILFLISLLFGVKLMRH